MRITIVTGPFYPVPPAPCGAVERLMRDLAETFAARGHEVIVLCRHWPEQNRNETINGVTYHRRLRPKRTGNIKIDLIKDLFYSVRMLLAVRKSDVIVTNVFWLPMLLTRLRPRSGKVVVNVNRQPKGQMGLYRRAARIVAVSTAIKDAIVAQRPDVAPIVRVIPNPIDTHAFTPPSLPRPSQVTTLIYTGRVHPEKGIHVLLEALRQLLVEFPHLRLRIIGQRNVTQGGGDEAYQKQLDDLATGQPVDFVDPIYHRQQLADELRGADLYVYPSLADLGEAMPVAPLEAMATGLVVVVSDMPQFRDYVEPDVTGLVFNHHSPDPAAELAATIRRVLSGECRVQEMRPAAARRAAQFGYDEVATLYLNDFAELLARKN